MKNKIKHFIIFFILFIIICPYSLLSSQDIDRASKLYAYNLMEKGVFHFNLNQYEAAIDYFTQTLRIYPSLLEAREWRAKSFYRAGQIENAREEYKRLISINPEDLRLMQQLDEIDFILGHPETFSFTPNYISSAIYPLKTFKNEILPISISLISKDKVAITDFYSGKVGFYSIDGKYLFSIPTGNERFGQPFDITSDNNGNFYITDYKDNFIYKYSSDFKQIGRFGGSGNSESSLYGPRGIVSDGNYNLYVVDRWNRKIKKFNNNGDYILSVENRVDGLYELDEPYDIAYINEIVYVTDSKRASIFAFDNYGTFIKEIKSPLIQIPRGISLSNNKKQIIIVDEKSGILFMNIETGKIEKVSDLSKIKGRFLSAVETYDGRILGINESIGGLFAFVEELVKSSGLFLNVLRSAVTNQEDGGGLISHLLSITDKLGRPVIDISVDDITIIERGIELGHPKAIGKFPNLEKDGVAITIVNELSNETKEKKDDIKKFLLDIAKKLRPEDSLQIININKDINKKNSFNSSPLECAYLFDQDEYTNIKNVIIGKGLIYGIGQALSVYNKSSVVIFITAGNTPEECFGDVTAGYIYNYSLANSIPIYTVVFGKDSQNDFLSRLASESGGNLINYYKSPEINKLIEIIKEKRKQYYIITYNTIIGNANEFRYKEAIIEITSNGMTSSTKVGYFDRLQ